MRQALLLCTARLIAQHGLAALTVQEVADAAGVSMGALALAMAQEALKLCRSPSETLPAAA
ncbi:TetR family transcriptional regulator [Stenotrophomonas sp. ZAC14D2_NAIMI4_7]|uniref:TetR family transcriptional regulator n=1 Tax=Stenotrophomonas sp. ZAC14D2_NAIMI4_7 TaxID=2072405 RepID=UPI00131F0523|nr:TetR family transcriptional regulator [Stenotrophomonas sp. ZAC14D2_NAIMI4_7]